MSELCPFRCQILAISQSVSHTIHYRPTGSTLFQRRDSCNEWNLNLCANSSESSLYRYEIVLNSASVFSILCCLQPGLLAKVSTARSAHYTSDTTGEIYGRVGGRKHYAFSRHSESYGRSVSLLEIPQETPCFAAVHAASVRSRWSRPREEMAP